MVIALPCVTTYRQTEILHDIGIIAIVNIFTVTKVFFKIFWSVTLTLESLCIIKQKICDENVMWPFLIKLYTLMFCRKSMTLQTIPVKPNLTHMAALLLTSSDTLSPGNTLLSLACVGKTLSHVCVCSYTYLQVFTSSYTPRSVRCRSADHDVKGNCSSLSSLILCLSSGHFITQLFWTPRSARWRAADHDVKGDCSSSFKVCVKACRVRCLCKRVSQCSLFRNVKSNTIAAF